MQKDLLQLQKDFVNLRLGMFIHFNSATFQFHTGDIEDWEFEHENGGIARKFPFDPKQWNPKSLDCTQWAKTAELAGIQFAALTTKHHEGFCLWPSAYTEHCVKNSPNKTDVVKEYLSAFRTEGIQAGLYFSILDLTQGIGKRHCADEDREYIKNQLRELLTNYGEIPFLVLDGWNSPWGGPSYENLSFEEIDELVKSIQPNCLILNIGSLDGLKHSDIVFYENGAGQEIEDEFCGPGIICQTLTKCWFWRADYPQSTLKSAEWAVDFCRKANTKNVALILNSSPNPDGLLDDNLAERYAEIGKLYEIPAPIEELPAGWLTRK